MLLSELPGSIIETRVHPVWQYGPFTYPPPKDTGNPVGADQLGDRFEVPAVNFPCAFEEMIIFLQEPGMREGVLQKFALAIALALHLYGRGFLYV